MSRLWAAAALALVIATPLPGSAQTDLGRRVTIDVTEAAPQKVFESLARSLGCTITVDPAVKKAVTLRVVEMTANDVIVMVCQSIGCEYRFDGKDLFVKPLSGARKRQIASMEAHSKKLQSRLPAGMHFDGKPLKCVLDTVGQATGLELRPWKDEGSRKVTIDVGGMVVDEALAAIVRQIGGEGVVMMRTWAGSWGQHRVVENPGE
jgi:type II secretory pathway component GspD/PulD (secretin)